MDTYFCQIVHDKMKYKLVEQNLMIQFEINSRTSYRVMKK